VVRCAPPPDPLRQAAAYAPSDKTPALLRFIETLTLDEQLLGAKLFGGTAEFPPDPALPDDTRLWAVLQQAGGGTWGGCVYDTDAIAAKLGIS
jgi:hypothetical protein